MIPLPFNYYLFHLPLGFCIILPIPLPTFFHFQPYSICILLSPSLNTLCHSLDSLFLSHFLWLFIYLSEDLEVGTGDER